MKKITIHNLLFAFLFAAAGVFGFSAWTNSAQAEFTPHIIINEIQIAGATSNDEFIELFNPTDALINLEGYKLTKKAKTGSSESALVSAAKFSGIIEARGYFLVSHPDYKDKISADLSYSGSTYYISNDNTVFLYDKSGALLDKVGFGAASDFEAAPAPNPDANQSLERIDFIDTDDNASDFSINIFPSPKNRNTIESDNQEESFNSDNEAPAELEQEIENDPKNISEAIEAEIETEEKNSADVIGSETENEVADENVYLSEIMPNPEENSDEEYIEITSGESDPVDLFDWQIKDGSKSKGYQFKEHIVLSPGEYFVIYRFDSKIALNNSNESIYLYNPQGKVVSSASFEKSQKGASYNFDGKRWRWSKYLTPSKKNKLDSEPSVKVKKMKRIYKGVYTEFSAVAKDKETKELKYVWDFGDGKKSYLAKTSHKYLDTGKYTVTLTVSDESQTVEKSFALTVKKYPQLEVEIVRIIPNPAGADLGNETVSLKNNSHKRVSLDGWKIAAGSNEKLYNHPISDGIILDSGETKIISREMSKFTLNNESGRVQLVSPDESVSDEVEYAKEKIVEDEAYAKIDGKWQWIAPPGKEKSLSEENNSSEGGEVLSAINEKYSAQTQTGYTFEDEFIFYKIFGLLYYKPRKVNYCPINQHSSIFAHL